MDEPGQAALPGAAGGGEAHHRTTGPLQLATDEPAARRDLLTARREHPPRALQNFRCHVPI